MRISDWSSDVCSSDLNPDAWGTALKDPLIPVGDPVGDTYVLITHSHSDHFDPMAAAQALHDGGTLVHPAGVNPLPVPPGARVRPSAPWEPQLLGDFTATQVPASDGYGDRSEEHTSDPVTNEK